MSAIEEPAKTVAALLATEVNELPVEILKIDKSTAAIITEVDNVDYVLTITRAPQQRRRAVVN